MEQSWQPNPDVVTQAFGLLQALRDPTHPNHHSAITTLTQNATQPLFILHMLHIFAQGYQYESVGLGVDMRQLAGLIIKNYVFPYLPSLTEDVQNMMKNAFLQALHDTIPDIRRTAAILIGRITESFPSSFWIGMVPVMVEYLDPKYIQTQPFSVEGNLTALLLVCEDSASKLAHATDGSGQALRPLDALVPKLLELLTITTNSGMRVRILQCYNCLLYLLDASASVKASSSSRSSLQGLRSRNTSMDSERLSSGRNSFTANNSANSHNSPILTSHQSAVNISALILHMNTFIQLLAVVAQDSDGSVRKHVVLSITIIAFYHVSLLEQYFPNICEFMLTALGDREECVGIEACEFWHALLGSQDTKKAMLPYLPRVLAALITRLRLTDEQMQAERLLEEDEHRGLKQVTFQSFRYRRRQRYFRPAKKYHPNTLNSNNSMVSQSNNSPNASNYSIQSGKHRSVSTSDESDPSHNNHANNNTNYDDDDGGVDSEKEKEELSANWTLRKQAALTLDTFAKAYPPQDILAAALPLIQAYLHPDSRTVTQQLLTNLGITVPPATNQAVASDSAGGGVIDDSVFLQEAGMLALGCLSEGCLTSMSIYMLQLVPLWCQHIDTSPLPEMRAIVCWVISRYVSLLAQDESAGDTGKTTSGEVWFTPQQAQEMYLSCFQKVLERIFDPHPRVQVAACSALAILLAHAFDINNNNNNNNTTTNPNSNEKANILHPYLPTIFQGLKHALESGRLGVKASLLVVDCVGVISETFTKEDIVRPGHIDLLMPNLVQLYLHYDTNAAATSTNTLSQATVREYQYDARLFPVLDCFTSLWPVLGMTGKEFVPLLYEKLLTMLRTTLFPSRRGANAGISGFVLPPVDDLSSVQPFDANNLSSMGGATQIITANLTADSDDEDVDFDADDDLQKDFAICALDVLSAIGEGVKGHFSSLLTCSYPVVLQILATALQDHSRHAHSHPQMKPYQYYLPELVQSTFSLVGELVKQCFGWLVDTACPLATSEYVVSPHVTRNYLYLLLHFASYHLEQQDYLDYPFLYNNAAWVVGEITLQLLAHSDVSTHPTGNTDNIVNASQQFPGSGQVLATTATAASGAVTLHPDVWIKPFHPAILPALSMAIQTGDIPDTVKMNLAISLARLTLGGALEDMLEMGIVDDCFAAWCTIFHPWPTVVHDVSQPVVQFSDNTYSVDTPRSNGPPTSSSPVPIREKLQAFLGILVVVHHYPELIWQNKTNLYAFLCALLTFEHDLIHIFSPTQSDMTGDSAHAHVLPYFYPPHLHPQAVSIADIYGSALWRYLLQHFAENTFPLSVLWGLIQAEMMRIFTHGMNLMQQPDNNNNNGGVSGTNTSSSSGHNNGYGKLWQRVWVSMRQQYDVRFFTHTFGLTL
jgi:hypothetical protein